jgi:hypothetical protein
MALFWRSQQKKGGGGGEGETQVYEAPQLWSVKFIKKSVVYTHTNMVDMSSHMLHVVVRHLTHASCGGETSWSATSIHTAAAAAWRGYHITSSLQGEKTEFPM